MLAVEMLFLDTIRRRLHLRIDKLGVACHLRHFLQYDRIVDCLCGILVTASPEDQWKVTEAGTYQITIDINNKTIKHPLASAFRAP